MKGEFEFEFENPSISGKLHNHVQRYSCQCKDVCSAILQWKTIPTSEGGTILAKEVELPHHRQGRQ